MIFKPEQQQKIPHMAAGQHQLQAHWLQQDDILFDYYAQKQFRSPPNKKHKKMVILLFLIAFLAYRFLYETSLEPGQCILDMTHRFTQVINIQLNKDGQFAYYFMIVGQFFVDMNLMVFIIFQMFKMENFFISVFIALFYGIRGVFLNIEKFPYPQNVYWDQPGFPPSIGVPYGITSDYFYSGHTGMILFSLLFWSEKQETKFLKYLSMVGFPYIIILVLSSRVHYLADVFAAIFFCLWIYRFSKKNLALFDKLFSKGYFLSIYVLTCIDSWIIFVLRLRKTKKIAQKATIV